MALVPYVSSCSSVIPKKRSRQNSSNGSQDIDIDVDIDGPSICPGNDIIMGATGESLLLQLHHKFNQRNFSPSQHQVRQRACEHHSSHETRS